MRIASLVQRSVDTHAAVAPRLWDGAGLVAFAPTSTRKRLPARTRLISRLGLLQTRGPFPPTDTAAFAPAWRTANAP
jgi:hypothetical protein